jgi:hypothetical protein
MRGTLPHLERAIHVGLEMGDLEWAGYCSVCASADPPSSLISCGQLLLTTSL